MNPKFEQSAGDQDFVLSNGIRLDSIRDLYYILDTISNDVYNHHVTSEKNDFAQWIKRVFNEEELADHVLLALDREDLRTQIEEWNTPVPDAEKHTDVIDAEEITLEEKGDISNETKEKVVIKKLKEPNELEEISHSLKDMKNELHTKMQPHILAGILDFVFGFVIGALAMILLFRLI